MNSSMSLIFSSTVAISSKWTRTTITCSKPTSFKRCFCLSAPKPSTSTTTTKRRIKNINNNNNNNNVVVVRSKKEIEAELKEKWLESLSSSLSSTSPWVVGVDPDVSGAIALLKPTVDGLVSAATCSAQVFDSPHVTILIGNRSRRRLDARSIVNLLKSFDAPVGTTAYVEQSIPFPQDGKQGWWSSGFGYGLWIGTLVALGFSVVPVSSLAWKNKFCLSGSRSSKDDSRELASTLFPTMCPLLKRKKDHGRAEALLIAAYGRGMKSTDLQGIPEDLM